MPDDLPPEPWHSFFLEIDKTLDHPVELHCIGGFAMAMLHGLPRPTVDVDCRTAIPVEEIAPLQLLAGEGSALLKKYGVYLQHVGIVTVPENYAGRLAPTFPAAYRRLLLLGLERPCAIETGTKLGSRSRRCGIPCPHSSARSCGSGSPVFFGASTVSCEYGEARFNAATLA